LSIINRGRSATVEKFIPEEHYQWLLLVENFNSIPIWQKYFAGRLSQQACPLSLWCPEVLNELDVAAWPENMLE